MAKGFGKRAQVLDLLYFFMIVFMVAVVGVITMYVMSQARGQIQADSLIQASSVEMITNYEARAPSMIDQLVVVVIVGVGIVTLVSSMMVMSSPIFYGLMLIVMSFLTWIGAIYANVFQEIASQSDWSAYAEKLIMTSYIMKYFPMTIIILSVIIVVVMVAKR